MAEDEDVYLTRLHIRYNRADWSQDIQFQSTPNNQSFRVNFPLLSMATDNLNCQAVQPYLYQVAKRREGELQTLTFLTGWGMNKYAAYPNVWKQLGIKKEAQKKNLIPPSGPIGGGANNWWWLYVLGGIAALSQIPFKKWKSVHS